MVIVVFFGLEFREEVLIYLFYEWLFGKLLGLYILIVFFVMVIFIGFGVL